MELISSYTRKQAIEDGVLIDLSENDVIRQHWKDPFACTCGVWATIEKACESGIHDLDGILHDISFMAKYGKIDGSISEFKVIIGRETCRLWLHCGPGDDTGLVLTLMYPSEY